MNMSTFSGQRAARGSRGFTLIEMAITMAIIAILVSIALPAYTSYIARAKRADARTTLLQGAQYMQRFYAANDQYEKDRGGADLVDNMPANLMRSPSDGETVQYTLTVDPSVTAYTLTMTPVAGASMASDPCGSFRITSTGLKSVVGATKSRDECWK